MNADDLKDFMPAKERLTCCVVYGRSCKAPANFDFAPSLRSKCFACGEPVCVNCSTKVEWYRYGKQRICYTCQVDYAKPDRDKVKAVEERHHQREVRLVNAPYKPRRK